MQGMPNAATPPPFAAPGGFQAPQVRGRTALNLHAGDRNATVFLVSKRPTPKQGRPVMRLQPMSGTVLSVVTAHEWLPS